MSREYKNIIIIMILFAGLLFAVKGCMHLNTDILKAAAVNMEKQEIVQLPQMISSPELQVLEQSASCSMIGGMIDSIREKEENSSCLRMMLLSILYISILTLLARSKSGLFAYLESGNKIIDSLLSQIQIIHQMDGKKRNTALLSF